MALCRKRKKDAQHFFHWGILFTLEGQMMLPLHGSGTLYVLSLFIEK